MVKKFANEEEAGDAMISIMAYDIGATDSGVHDEDLRQQLKDYMEQLDKDSEGALGYPEKLGASAFLSRVLRSFVTEEALADGYDIEDAKEFIDWLAEWMDYVV